MRLLSLTAAGCMFRSLQVSLHFCSHLVENKPVEVRHVALVGQRPFVVVLKMLLQGHRVVRDLHHRAQVVRQHLKN